MSAKYIDEGKDKLGSLDAASTVEIDYTKHPRYLDIVREIQHEYDTSPSWTCAACKTTVLTGNLECHVCYTSQPPVEWVAQQRIKQLQAQEIIEDAQVHAALKSEDDTGVQIVSGTKPIVEEPKTNANDDVMADLYRVLGITNPKSTSASSSGTYRDALGRKSNNGVDPDKALLAEDINYDEEKERPKYPLNAHVIATTSFILPQFVKVDKTYRFAMMIENPVMGPVWPQSEATGESAVSVYWAAGFNCLTANKPVQYLSPSQSDTMLEFYEAQLQEHNQARTNNQTFQFLDISVPQEDYTPPKVFPYSQERVLAEVDLHLPSIQQLLQSISHDQLWRYADLTWDENKRRAQLRANSQTDGKGQGGEVDIAPYCVALSSYFRLGYPRGAVVPNATTPHFARQHRFVGVTFDPATNMPVSVNQDAIIFFGPWIGLTLTIFDSGNVYVSLNSEHNKPAPDPTPPRALISEFTRLDNLYNRHRARRNASGVAFNDDTLFGPTTGGHKGDYSGMGSQDFANDDAFVGDETFAGDDAGPPPLYDDGYELINGEHDDQPLNTSDAVDVSNTQATTKSALKSSGSGKKYANVKVVHNLDDSDVQTYADVNDFDDVEYYDDEDDGQVEITHGQATEGMSASQIRNALSQHDNMGGVSDEDDFMYGDLDNDELQGPDETGDNTGDGSIWTCKICTLENPLDMTHCGACDSQRRI